METSEYIITIFFCLCFQIEPKSIFAAKIETPRKMIDTLMVANQAKFMNFEMFTPDSIPIFVWFCFIIFVSYEKEFTLDLKQIFKKNDIPDTKRKPDLTTMAFMVLAVIVVSFQRKKGLISLGTVHTTKER